MKWVVRIVSAILILVGLVWILQGINVLPGSFMSGNPLYTVLGLVLDVIGIGLLVILGRRRARMS